MPNRRKDTKINLTGMGGDDVEAHMPYRHIQDAGQVDETEAEDTEGSVHTRFFSDATVKSGVEALEDESPDVAEDDTEGSVLSRFYSDATVKSGVEVVEDESSDESDDDVDGSWMHGV